MKNTWYPVILFMLAPCSSAFAQKIDTAFFKSLRNKGYIAYKDDKGKDVGCDLNLECQGMEIVFYKIELNKEKRTIELEGRIMEARWLKDSAGIPGVNILLAQPLGGQLRNIKQLPGSYLRLNEEKNSNVFPYRNGDFKLEASLSKDSRLYFADPMFRLLEYDIGKLPGLD